MLELFGFFFFVFASLVDYDMGSIFSGRYSPIYPKKNTTASGYYYFLFTIYQDAKEIRFGQMFLL